MAGDSKDVELRIRATLDGKKNLTETVDALKALSTAQDQQLIAAKKGEIGAKQLQNAYDALAKVAESLVSKSALVREFQSQSDVFDEIKARVEAARQAQQNYARSIDGSREPTKAQTTELNRLASAVKAAEGAQTRFENRVAKGAAKLADYGIATADLASAQGIIAAALQQVDTALQRQSTALQTLDADLNAAKRATEAAAKAELDRTSAIADATKRDQERAALSAKWVTALNGIEKAREKDANAAKAEKDAEAAGLKARSEALSSKWVVALNAIEKARAKSTQAAVDEKNAEQAGIKARADSLSSKWVGALNAIEKARAKETAATEAQTTAELKLRAALVESADAAAAKVRGASTLARPTAAPVLANGTATIAATIDPGSAALANVNGIEQAVARLEARVASIKGPVKGYAEALREAEGAQRALLSVSRQIDGFQNQITALRAARAEYTQARAAVTALVQAMRDGTAGPDVTAQLAAAQGKLAAAARAMASETATARGMRTELRAAGVDTSNLAAAQTSLANQANRSVSATDAMAAAVKRYGKAAQDGRREGEGLGAAFARMAGERTTLSFFQRMRGEVLGLATAFIGVQAAVGLAKGAIDVALENAKILRGLNIVFEGDQARARQEFEYLRNTTQRLGVDLASGAKGYTKLAISAKAAGMTTQETRFIFENMATAARNAGLSNEEFEGTLKAVEQMLSKGVIQAEELKGQLGDRLPGAVSLLAQSMNKTVPELLKMMESGGVVAEYVLNLSRQAGITFGKVTDDAANRLQTAIINQERATRNFKEALGEAGFIEAYTEFMNKLAVLLNSEQGKALAKQLSAGFSAVVSILQFTVDNINFVKVGLEVLIGVGALAWLSKITLAFKTFAAVTGLAGISMTAVTGVITTAVTTMGGTVATVGRLTGAIGFLATAFKFLGRSIPIVGALLIAYDLGKAIYDKFKGDADRIRGEAASLKDDLQGQLNPLGASSKFANAGKQDGTSPTSPDGVRFVSPDQQTAKAVEAALKKNQGKLDTKDKSSRMTGAKAELEERIRIASEEVVALRTMADTEIKDAIIKRDTLAKIDKQLSQIRKVETQRYNNEHRAAVETQADRDLKIAMDLATELDHLADKNANKEANIDPNATFADRLRAREALASDSMDKLAAKAKQLDDLLKRDPKPKAAVDQRLADAGIKGGLPGAQKLIEQQRQLAIATAGKEAVQAEVDRLEKQLSDKQTVMAAKLGAEQTLYENGLITQAELLANRQQIQTEYNAEIDASAEKLQTFAATYEKLLDPTLFATLFARIRGLRAGLDAGRTGADAALKASEGNTNRLLEQRKLLLDDVNQRLQLGIITTEDAAALTNQINDRFKVSIVDSTEATIALIDQLKAMGVSPEVAAQLDSIRARMIGVKVETLNAQKAFDGLTTTIIDSSATGISSTLQSFGGEFAKMVSGQEKVSDGFENMAKTAAQTFAQLLSDIAAYIIKLQIANQLANSTNPTVAGIGLKMGGTKTPDVATPAPAAAPAAAGAVVGAADPGAALTTAATEAATIQTGAAITAATTTETAAIVSATTTEGAALTGAVIDKGADLLSATTEQTSATLAAGEITAAGALFAATVEAAAAAQAATSAFHTGGVVGAGAVMSRSVSPSVFSGAAKFHSGGLPGLRRDEVPAILKKGEEVMTRDDPRHILNGGGATPSSGGSSAGQRLVIVDDRAKVAEAMASAEGEQVTLMHVRRNLPTLKALLRS